MMNLVDIIVRVKGNKNLQTLVLFHKIYSTPNGIVNRWATKQNSDKRLEILNDGNDVSFENTRVIKDLTIISSEHEIAEQFISILFEQKAFEIKNSLSDVKTF